MAKVNRKEVKTYTTFIELSNIEAMILRHVVGKADLSEVAEAIGVSLKVTSSFLRDLYTDMNMNAFEDEDKDED